MLGHTLPDHQTEVGQRFEQCYGLVQANGCHVHVVHLDNLIAHLEATLVRQLAILDALHKDAGHAGQWTLEHGAAQRRAGLMATDVQMFLRIVGTVQWRRGNGVR